MTLPQQDILLPGVATEHKHQIMLLRNLLPHLEVNITIEIVIRCTEAQLVAACESSWEFFS